MTVAAARPPFVWAREQRAAQSRGKGGRTGCGAAVAGEQESDQARHTQETRGTAQRSEDRGHGWRSSRQFTEPAITATTLII